MLKKPTQFLISIIGLFIVIQLSGCTNEQTQKLGNVGLVIDNVLQDEQWNKAGYDGLQQIGIQYDVDVFLRENVQSKHDIINAVDELEKKGVNLIFGHSDGYGKMFVDVAKLYPDIHFVYFNGGYFRDNVTSLNINSYAMAFFSGMVAGKMTETNHVGIIAAYEWQPEIEGFYEGVKHENPEAIVHINYVNGWSDNEIAVEIYNEMKAKNTDVFYPADHSFSKDIIEHAMKDNLYSIGYFLEQEDYEDELLLTSTIHHIDLLYLETAEKYNGQLLEGGIHFYDFSDHLVTFGPFSSLVPKNFQETLQKNVNEYKQTHLLPHEKPKNE